MKLYCFELDAKFRILLLFRYWLSRRRSPLWHPPPPHPTPSPLLLLLLWVLFLIFLLKQSIEKLLTHSPTRHSRKLNRGLHNQCDQMARLFFNIGPFIARECTQSIKNYQRWYKILHYTNLSFQKYLHNIAKSGHTDSIAKSLLQRAGPLL